MLFWQVVELLVKCHANVNIDERPVAAAAVSEKWQMVQRLVELEADPNTPTSNKSISRTNGYVNPMSSTVLIQAVKAGEQELVRFLTSSGASANFVGEDSHESACGAAVSANHLGILRLLAEVRANLDGIHCDTVIHDILQLLMSLCWPVSQCLSTIFSHSAQEESL